MAIDVKQGTGVTPAVISSTADVPLISLAPNTPGNPVMVFWNLQVLVTAPGVTLFVTLEIDGAPVPVTERRVDGSMEIDTGNFWFAAAVNTSATVLVRRSVGGGADPVIAERIIVLQDQVAGVGATGPAGAVGPAGPTGPAGAAGTGGLSSVLVLALLASGGFGSSHGSSHEPPGPPFKERGPGFPTLGRLLTAKIGPKLVAKLPATVPLFLRIGPGGRG